jgi:hypothetical protein
MLLSLVGVTKTLVEAAGFIEGFRHGSAVDVLSELVEILPYIPCAVKRRDRLWGIKSEMMAPPHIVLLSNHLVLPQQDSKPRLFRKYRRKSTAQNETINAFPHDSFLFYELGQRPSHVLRTGIGSLFTKR